MRMCINKRVVAGLAAVALVVFALSPRLLGAFGPVLIMAACPLSMLVMMRGLSGRDHEPSAANREERRVSELEEEVNRLKAEITLRGESSSA